MRISRHLICCMTFMMLGGLCLAQERQSLSLEEALHHAARPEKKVRTLGHEWVWELERAGVYNRNLPKPYRLALPLATLGESGPHLMATYATPTGEDHRRLMLFMHFPLD